MITFDGQTFNRREGDFLMLNVDILFTFRYNLFHKVSYFSPVINQLIMRLPIKLRALTFSNNDFRLKNAGFKQFFIVVFLMGFLIPTQKLFAQENETKIFESIKVFPANPSTDDDIKLIIHTIQPSSPCFFDSVDFSMEKNIIDLTLFYRSYICPSDFVRIDTLNIGKFPLGKYELNANLFTSRNRNRSTLTDDMSISFKVEHYGLSSNDALNDISVYPNPFKDVLHLKNPSEEIHEITISNSIGQIVLKTKIESEIESLDLSDLQKGIYLLNVSNESYNRLVRIVKN